MPDDNDKTKSPPAEFDFSGFPENTLFFDRRSGRDRRDKTERGNPTNRAPQAPAPPRPQVEARVRKERRKRIDPTTFEKQYTDDELEFMNAMQRYKERTGKSFPTYAEVIKVAVSLGYLRPVPDDPVSLMAE
jgi:hypothetical protein